MKDTKQINLALENFRKEIDKIFVPKTPKLPKEMDKFYDCDIYIFRHPGMGNSLQIISGNKVSICTATSSYLESLLRQKLVTEEELHEIVNLSIQAYKGTLK